MISVSETALVCTWHDFMWPVCCSCTILCSMHYLFSLIILGWHGQNSLNSFSLAATRHLISLQAPLKSEPLTLSPSPVQSYCPTDQFSCLDKPHCISNDLLCDLNSDCPDDSDESRHCGACDFEHSRCGFVGSLGLTSWKRTSGSTWASGTGPSTDHTKGTALGRVFRFFIL